MNYDPESDRKMWLMDVLFCPYCKAKIKNRGGKAYLCTCTPEFLNNRRSEGGVFFAKREI